MNKRTDLAIENEIEDFKYDVDKIIDGMNLKKCYVDKKLSKKLMKNEGIYYNLDDIDYYNKDKQIIKILSSIIKDYLTNEENIINVLVVGLGNPTITPDSLGPLTINKIEVNPNENNYKYKVSAISPGVMGQTGMESSDIIKAIVKKFNFDLVIVIDALACNNPMRMCHSIQVSDAGINPGSGVGNNRKELSYKTLGCKALAIGIPTVSDINVVTEKYGNDFFVTPNNIDETMDILSLIISKSINKALTENKVH